MKTTIGGDRLGSGNKQEVSMRNYERSTHDLSYTWRSSMASGTLVPFMSQVALPGDTFDIDLACNVMTLPTVGPLFGSFKVQLDVFTVPVRLYNAELHMNKLGIGMNMENVKLPQIAVTAYNNDYNEGEIGKDNSQVNPSSLIKYLGISGVGTTSGQRTRDFNAIPYLGVWDIYKNYYANKQEERGVCIHTDLTSILASQAVVTAYARDENGIFLGYCFNTAITPSASVGNDTLYIQFSSQAEQPVANNVIVKINGTNTALTSAFNSVVWDATTTTYICSAPVTASTGTTWEVATQSVAGSSGYGQGVPTLKEFPLSNIDDMRSLILQWATPLVPFKITRNSLEPYSLPLFRNGATAAEYHISTIYPMEGLPIKTYQSDLFNNWISTDWIDGTNGINEITSIDTSGGSFTMDTLNLAQKVYVMLNRIAISGGSYDDWLDAVYSHERAKSTESPVYVGSLIKELAFEEVIASTVAENQPLGQLAGRGRLTDKNKGGKISIKIDEPSYIIGLVSLTPRIDYSQGNSWDMNLKTMNDFHKPALDAIGYQDLITDQMAWQDTRFNAAGDPIFKSAGKQPAWINYMTNVDKTYGNFAEESKEMFMTLNRKYSIDASTGITDLTTYIDPSKYNFIFADTNLDAQNFWVQIRNNITARRKMSAKVIPNL